MSVLVDHQPVRFDAPPELRGAQVFVPLRGVFERLGAKVSYRAGRVEAVGKAGQVRLAVGEAFAEVNGHRVVLLTPAYQRSNRVLVPLRFVSEALSAAVSYDPAHRVVSVETRQDPSDL